MKFKIGDMVRIVNSYKVDCEVEDAKFGVIVDIADIEELAGTPDSVFMYDSKGDYIEARYFGEGDLAEQKFSIGWEFVTDEDGFKFHVNDKVKMIDEMEDVHFNATGLGCEYGIIREIDTKDDIMPYLVEFYNPRYSFWCEGQQLELIE